MIIHWYDVHLWQIHSWYDQSTTGIKAVGWSLSNFAWFAWIKSNSATNWIMEPVQYVLNLVSQILSSLNQFQPWIKSENRFLVLRESVLVKCTFIADILWIRWTWSCSQWLIISEHLYIVYTSFQLIWIKSIIEIFNSKSYSCSTVRHTWLCSSKLNQLLLYFQFFSSF